MNYGARSLKIKLISVSPRKLKKLEDLNLSYNKFAEVPEVVYKLKGLHALILGNNQICEVEVGYSFTQGPRCVCLLTPILCHPIFLTISYLISVFQGKKFAHMNELTLFSIENNNLKKLSNEIGLIPNLKTLMVAGNAFKMPNAGFIAKGSAAVIEYLRNRCPQLQNQ